MLWPARDVALDAERMTPRLTAALQLARKAVREPEVTLVKEVEGRRCVIRYRVAGRVVSGKLYRDEARGERTLGHIRTLRASLDARAAACIPDLLGWVPETGLLLQEWRGGQHLCAGLVEGETLRCAAAAAHWIAALHTVPTLVGLKRRTLEYEVKRLAQFADQVAQHTPGGPPSLSRARTDLVRAAGRLGTFEPTVIHKDFYHAHVLWDGSRLSVLDFDELSVGDPAFDVGHFLTHVERQRWLLPDQARVLGAAAQRFADTYPGMDEPGFRDRVAFYRGYTALKLAATEARRGRPGWAERAETLLEYAGAQAAHIGRRGA